MAFDRAGLADLIATHGAVMRLVVAEVAGSAPREVGAAMIVWAGGATGTIGGGALEWQAIRAAGAMLARGEDGRLDRLPLGPALGQCCGGAVTILTERWDAARLAAMPGPVIARPLPGQTGAEMPLPVARMLARARGQGILPAPGLLRGWMVEPDSPPARDIWIWGAGHVGRAVVGVLHPLPGLRLTCVDTDAARFPALPQGVVARIAANPADLVAEAPGAGEHLVMTFSHALDLELCHRLLAHGFARLGLIGSATKRARFLSRLAALGHGADQLARLTCPIGDPALGKHPQAIAVGVGAWLLRPSPAARTAPGDGSGDGDGMAMARAPQITQQ